MTERRAAMDIAFVDLLPDHIYDGIVYVSIRHRTVIHRCACGCGFEVVTPISPNEWKLTYDGEGLGLHPSIGNADFPCRSHYWITTDGVVWAPNFGTEPERVADARPSLFHRIINALRRSLHP